MKNRIFLPLFILIQLTALVFTRSTPYATLGSTPYLAASSTFTRVSIGSNGEQGNGDSESFWGFSLPTSANGQRVVFESIATNLINEDTNDVRDIFVHDVQTGQTTRVSVASDNTQGNDSSYTPAISADGRYVAFYSLANNLVSGDNNGVADVFLHDMQSGETTRVSIASDGIEGNSQSFDPSLSEDGRYIAFESQATNLVSGDDNGVRDVFVHDIQTRETIRVSISSSGVQGDGISLRPSLSANGRYVAFRSLASNLVSGDTNGVADVFVHDIQTGQTISVSIASDGAQGNYASDDPSISADGQHIAFHSSANNLVSDDTNGQSDVFIHNTQTEKTTRVSIASDGTQGNGASNVSFISENGQFIVFHSTASNLVSEDTNGWSDVFVHDIQTGQTTLVSIANNGTQGNNNSSTSSISADGRYVVFVSEASNLISEDTNGRKDIFVYDLGDLTPPSDISDLIASTGNATGQVNLSWTSPGNDGNVGTAITYTVRYADSAITTELGWLSASDVAGEPAPQPAGTPESLTVSGLTPGQTYYFAIRTEDEAVNLSELSNSPSAMAKESIDLGFRPNPDGYQFANPGYTQPTCSDFQRSYSGLSIQCANNQPQQEYQALFKDYRDTFSTGVCTGMAASSLLYYTGVEPLPQPGTTFDLDASQAQANIATYHGRQQSKAVLDIVVPSWRSWTDDSAVISQRVDDVYNQIKASLSSGNNNPLVLDLFPRSSCGTSGHTIVPYRLDDTDPLHPKVYVYENFNPTNADKFIQFNLAASTHSFNYWLWDSTSCGTLVAIPVNTFTSSNGKIPGTQLHISTGGNVEPLLTNSTGEMVGYNNGELTATITDAMPVFPWYTPGITSTVTSFLTPPDMYTTTLSSSGDGYTFTVWSSSGTLELQADGQNTPFTNNLLSTTNTDLISFDADLHSAVLSTNDIQGQSIALQLSIPDTNDSQVYTLDNVNLLTGGNLIVDALDSELRLVSNGILTNYTIYFDRISTQTLSAFAHADLTLLANDKHFLTFSDGDNALLQIDHGGDGSIDETIVLENQVDAFYKVYLPTILR